ncbi:WD domain, G-beta repeat protein [Necator americanus]|uniref:Coronin n=1 Tax=Necator americanus TaxID=51031 RepID=W2TI13_NECAM|nr:WD domain, G-beta repeat protein [Necator americanus]ETN80791.1 WD domain, G-beta repeat protein [Necator americanus]
MAQIVRQSKFRHVYCKPVKHEQCMSDIRVTEITWDSLFCSVNPKFIAFITKGAGGPFMVIPINKVGRIDKDYPFVDAHKGACLEVAWSPFNDNVIASCSEDTTCKVWLIPENGLLRTLSQPVVELNGHQKRVNTLAWHPVANNLLLTAGGENKLLLWNVGTGEALLEIAGHPDQIWSIAFNYDGTQFVTTCKDKKIRILDTRSGEVVHEGVGHEGVKPQRAIFVHDGRVITTGFTKRSERLYALRAPDNLSQPIIEEELDTSNGVLFPFYDEDTGLVYLCGKGDCAIRYYEVNQEYPYMHYINTYTTSEPQRAVGFQCKRGVNSEENEINRYLRVIRKQLLINVRTVFNILFSPHFRADSQRSHSEQSSPQVSAPPSPRPQPAQQRRPIIDDDMGIVPMNQARPPSSNQHHQERLSPERPAQKTPKQQVNLRSRAERDDGGSLTAGQRRAAAELERIKRDQARTATEEDYGPPPGRLHATPSPRMSVSSMEGPTNMEELLADLAKMKAVMRQHERRIRILEEEIAEKNMSQAYSF